MASYDPEKLTISFGGFTISGFSDEDIEITPNEEDAVTEHVGIKGEHSYTEQTDKSGILKFSLKQSSFESNNFLNAARLSKSEAPLIVKDLSAGSPITIVSDRARIKNQPTNIRGKEESMVEWKIAIPRLNPQYI